MIWRVFVKTQTTALLLALTATPSTACFISKPRDFAVFREAEVIISARVTRYEKQPASHIAIFALEVVETHRGPHGIREWTARWQNSSFAEPDRWDGPTDVIVGLKAVIDYDGIARIEVVQQSCGPTSILADTPRNLQQIVDALR
ncbi:hypothetical protein ASD52_27650 [Ensifer sp. Root142]|nr:hypothetical protein ASD01_13070 [Ensifer sp. Root423]KQY73186.1 hypothetical protein ASD52_27650 [Ensifer sp. Root142]